MNEPLSFIERLAGLRSWLIISLGVLSTMAAFLVVGLVVQVGYDNLPVSAWGPLIIAHLFLAGIAVWLAPKPFIEAFLLRHVNKDSQLHEVRSMFPDVDE